MSQTRDGKRVGWVAVLPLVVLLAGACCLVLAFGPIIYLPGWIVVPARATAPVIFENAPVTTPSGARWKAKRTNVQASGIRDGSSNVALGRRALRFAGVTVIER